MWPRLTSVFWRCLEPSATTACGRRHPASSGTSHGDDTGVVSESEEELQYTSIWIVRGRCRCCRTRRPPRSRTPPPRSSCEPPHYTICPVLPCSHLISLIIPSLPYPTLPCPALPCTPLHSPFSFILYCTFYHILSSLSIPTCPNSIDCVLLYCNCQVHFNHSIDHKSHSHHVSSLTHHFYSS